MKYIFLSAIAFTILSCSKNYKIVEKSEGHIVIELPARTSVENLINYGDDVTEDIQAEQCFIVFLIPSEYPNNPGEAMWAKMTYYKNKIDGVEIPGTRTDLHKKNLLAIKPKGNQVIGKWYYSLPITERIIFIEEIDGKILLRQTAVKMYCHRLSPDDIEIPENDMFSSNQWSETEFSEWDDIELLRNPDNPNEFKEKQWEKGTWRYRIDHGKLYFLDENGKVSKYNPPAIPVSRSKLQII